MIRYVLLENDGKPAKMRDGKPFVYSSFHLAKLGRKWLKSIHPGRRYDIEVQRP
jgi:hypothetical protein